MNSTDEILYTINKPFIGCSKWTKFWLSFNYSNIQFGTENMDLQRNIILNVNDRLNFEYSRVEIYNENVNSTNKIRIYDTTENMKSKKCKSFIAQFFFLK